MNEERNAQMIDMRRLLGYKVLDKNNQKLGTVDGLWEDPEGEPAFLSISTGWLGMGRSHFVPADSAGLSESGKAVKLPYDGETVKNAPDFKTGSDIDESTVSRLYDYYRKELSTGENRADWSASREEDAQREPRQERRERREDRRVPRREARQEPAIDPRPEAEGALELKEEEVEIGKRVEPAGGVRLRKVVHTETVNQPVELSHEEIQIERVPADSERPADSNFREEEIFIPLRRERPDVRKTAKVKERVVADVRSVKKNENVSEQVRQEDVDIRKEP